MEFSVENQIAYISIDDGKANAASVQFVEDMYSLLDRAKNEAKAVVLHGRAGMFSAGFDLKEIQQDLTAAKALTLRGLTLLTDIYAHPQPIVAACDGHAVGLGAFLLLVSDVRIGSAAEYNITLPETALGWGFPPVLMSLIKERIPSNHQTSLVLQAKPYTAEEAVSAGFLDTIVERESLMDECRAIAEQLSQLPAKAYATNKEELRAEALSVMRKSIG